MADERSGSVARILARGGYWGEAEARVVVEAWRRSGETLSCFTRRHGVKYERLRRWAGRLEGSAEPEPVRLHPVRVVGREEGVRPSDERLEIVLDAGCSVRVAPGFAAEDLERVLSVLAVGS